MWKIWTSEEAKKGDIVVNFVSNFHCQTCAVDIPWYAYPLTSQYLRDALREKQEAKKISECKA